VTAWIILASATASTYDRDVELCATQYIWQPSYRCVAEQEYERSGARLNAQWTATLRGSRVTKGNAAAKRIQREQRQWFETTDAQCHAFADPTPSSQQGRNMASCLTARTNKRNADLRAMIESR
jgi:uncharacterized protein YecT (DUF1311 family)